MNRTILAIILLASVAFATTNINDANFQASLPQWHFTTDMQLNTDFTLQLVSGSMLSGNPLDIGAGDKVCSGSVLQVVPSVSAKWATPDLNIVSIYPTCGGGYCPAMIPYTTVNTNRDVKWLPSSTFNTLKSVGDANDWSQNTANYDLMGTFHTQTMTYEQTLGVFESGKRGGANVFCKGDLVVRDGSTNLGTMHLPTLSSPTFTVSSPGYHSISTRITNAACFAASEKHPLNRYDHPSMFFYYYYTHNAPTSELTASSLASDSVLVTVVNEGGVCLMNEITDDVVASEVPADTDFTMVKVPMKNNGGDQIKVTSVTGSNANFDYDPFPVASCGSLGLGSLCPSSNGFNECILPGATKNLYVLLERLPGATDGTVLSFGAETCAAVCGSTSTCNDLVDLTGPITCRIEPPAFAYCPLEVAEFTVECKNLVNITVPCTGDDWWWGGGLSGDFIEKSSLHALAYSTSPAGSTGTLNYKSGTGIAECHTDVTLVSSDCYECTFSPPSAEMNTTEEQYFELICFDDGSPSTPDDADYDIIDGLLGTTSNSSTDGTTFTAGADSDGNLRGYGEWNNPADDPVLGAVALAPIKIGSGGPPDETNTTGGGGDENDGTSIWCSIAPIVNPYPGGSGYTNILCGPDHDEPCENITWSSEGYVLVSGGTDAGTNYQITGNPGDRGKIFAYVDGKFGQSCWRGFTILTPECWEFT